MLVRTVKRFYDLTESTFREVGTSFDVSPERFEEINSHHNYGTLVEAVPQDKPKAKEVTEETPARANESDSEGTTAKRVTRRRKTQKKDVEAAEEAPQEG